MPRHDEFHVGDVVKAPSLRAGERGLMVEGLVVEVVGAGAGGDGAGAPGLLIHFEDEVDGGATEQRDAADVQRVLPWHAYERGDLVEVRDADGAALWYRAIVEGFDHDAGEGYVVAYENDDDGATSPDVERGVAEARIRKIRSGRARAAKEWRKAGNAIIAANRLAFHPSAE